MFQSTQQEAIDTISETISKFAIAKTLMFVSGGSSAKITVESLKNIDEKNRRNITVILADERCVGYNSTDSNGALLKKLGIQNYCNEFIEILSQKNNDGKFLAQNFCDNLEKHITATSNIVGVFGIGTNNHIAGIFPDSIAAKSIDKLAVFYMAEDFERITITPRVFEIINTGFIYAEGNNKQDAILDLLKTSSRSELVSSEIKPILSGGEVPVGTSTTEKSVLVGRNSSDEAGISRKSSTQTLSQDFDTISHPSQLIKKCKEYEIFFNKEGL